MCGSPRPARSRESGAGRWLASGRRLARAVALVFGLVLTVAVASPSALAQSPTPTPTPTPTPSPSTTPLPSPTPTSTSINSDLSAGATVTNLGSNFLERLGGQASSGLGRTLRTNPGGGGASEATDAPRFRTWGETYGISVNTGAQADFVGDHRQTWGGVAGLGATVAPGVNLGVSVDQRK